MSVGIPYLQFLRVGLFVTLLIFTYYLALRWTICHLRGTTPAGRFQHFFHARSTGVVVIDILGAPAPTPTP